MRRNVRRSILIGLTLCGVIRLACAAEPPAADKAASVESLSVLPDEVDGVAPKEMMKSYFKKLAFAALDRRDAEYENLKTPEQLADYQQRLRKFFVEALGGFPERTPLNAKVVGSLTRDGYRVEKVIFESQPKHYVTAAVFLPEGKAPFPGVIVPCGHSANGKAIDVYQRACILLAKNGIAAMCYDPIGQGERSQILSPDGKAMFGSTLEHTMVGVSSIPLGAGTARYRIWDGVRALDYLASRDDIDPSKLGCTGNSGGGTLTSYLMALDDRIYCAAPSCYLTSLRRLIETIGPQDAEQNIHGQIAAGMDHADYVIMRAPRPTIMCVATRDFFDIQGAWNSFRQAKRFYTRLGSAECVDLVEADEKHGFTMPLRVGMTRWMRRWLLDQHEPINEPEFAVLTDKELQCTDEGQVMQIAGARSVFDLNADWETKLASERRSFWASHESKAALAEVRRIAGVRPLDEVPTVLVTYAGKTERDGIRIEKLILRTEPGIFLPALAFVPEKPSGEAYLALDGEGKHVAAGAGGELEKLAREGHVVLTVDLRGCGETLTADQMKGGWDENVGRDWKNYMLGYLLGKSYIGMRAEDTLTCARFLAGYEARKTAAGSTTPNRVHLIAVGEAGPAALHAAALEPQLFASIVLRRSLHSFAGITRAPISKRQITNAIHGSLRVYDLPDLVAQIPDEKLTIEEPLNAKGEEIDKQ